MHNVDAAEAERLRLAEHKHRLKNDPQYLLEHKAAYWEARADAAERMYWALQNATENGWNLSSARKYVEACDAWTAVVKRPDGGFFQNDNLPF